MKYQVAINEHWLDLLGETMVELSANFYQKVYEILGDHTETACTIRDAAITFETEYKEEAGKDYMSKLLEFGTTMVEQLKQERNENK